MQRWIYTPVAVLLGAVAAAAAAIEINPLAAFLGTTALALAAGFIVHRQFHQAALPDTQGPSKPSARGENGEMPFGLGRMLVEKLPVPLLIITHKGRLSYANAAALATLPRLATGQHFAHIIRAPTFVESVSATLEDGRDRSFEFRAYEASDRHYEARVSMLALGDVFGAEARAIVMVEDRTHTYRAEQLRSDFIANASHELRTPLASIVGYIETLQNHAREDPEARERFLGIMAREAQRMQRLVDDLMSLSRIEMSEHVRPVERVSLHRIASDCALAFRPMARQENIELVVDLDPGGAEIIADPDQLAQVFANLIDNAMKYSGEGAHVRVHAAPESPAHPGRVGVSVSDTGVGIAKDKLPRLTERFYRVNVHHSRNKGGTGLGLAIVKHILNRHMGRIEVTSTPGKGSTFTVWLPRAASGERLRARPKDNSADPVARRASS
jgi:two-component system, OmpR family, phosphate regulon sensor histidine kinase PhoR